jgi:hypothetical protein
MPRRAKTQPEDEAFLDRFAARLEQCRDAWKGTKQTFAESLDLSATAVQKYIDRKSMPGVRTIALAAREHNIHVKYGDFSPKELVARARKKPRSAEAQMLLPFAIQALSQENVRIELADKKANSIELNVRIKFAS